MQTVKYAFNKSGTRRIQKKIMKIVLIEKKNANSWQWVGRSRNY